MLDRLHTSLTLLGSRTRTGFFIRVKFFAHVVSLSTRKVSPGFANTDKLKMNDSTHNYEESDEYLQDASDVDERENLLKVDLRKMGKLRTFWNLSPRCPAQIKSITAQAQNVKLNVR